MILNLPFLKTVFLSEFHLYLGLMDPLTSLLYHCFHGNSSVNGILAQFGPIHHYIYRSRNQSWQNLPLGPHTYFHSPAGLHRSVNCRLFLAKDVFDVFFKESSVAATDQGNGPRGWESTSCMKRAPPCNAPV